MNERHHKLSLELVDFHNYFGAQISRKQNRKDMIREFNPIMMDVPNMTMYIKGNALASLGQMMGFNKDAKDSIKLKGLNIEMIVKFRTNYKLNIISKEGRKLISNDESGDEEVHFVKFEGQYPEFELNRESIKKGFQDFNF